MMGSVLLGLLAETPIHAGCGRSLGAIDLPVAREAATDYPVVVGSSLKGALKDKAERLIPDDVASLFGKQTNAGALLVSDARLLLLPVRSLTGAYRWVTCPHLIERFVRDLRRAGCTQEITVPSVSVGNAITSSGNGTLFLEEREFSVDARELATLADAIKPLIYHQETNDRLTAQLVILHDDDFVWFARYGLSISARNVLDPDTKTSKNLWYEESLPPDTVMYAVLSERQDGSIGTFTSLFPDGNPYLQLGGNETVGHGWFVAKIYAPSVGGPDETNS